MCWTLPVSLLRRTSVSCVRVCVCVCVWSLSRWPLSVEIFAIYSRRREQMQWTFPHSHHKRAHTKPNLRTRTQRRTIVCIIWLCHILSDKLAVAQCFSYSTDRTNVSRKFTATEKLRTIRQIQQRREWRDERRLARIGRTERDTSAVRIACCAFITRYSNVLSVHHFVLHEMANAQTHMAWSPCAWFACNLCGVVRIWTH